MRVHNPGSAEEGGDVLQTDQKGKYLVQVFCAVRAVPSLARGDWCHFLLRSHDVRPFRSFLRPATAADCGLVRFCDGRGLGAECAPQNPNGDEPGIFACAGFWSFSSSTPVTSFQGLPAASHVPAFAHHACATISVAS